MLRPAFSIEQRTSIATWNLVRPAGLGVRFITDHERVPEVAALFRHDAEDVRYRMNPTRRGSVVLIRSSGQGKWELPNMEAALAKVLVLERLIGSAWRPGPKPVAAGEHPRLYELLG